MCLFLKCNHLYAYDFLMNAYNQKKKRIKLKFDKIKYICF